MNQKMQVVRSALILTVLLSMLMLSPWSSRPANAAQSFTPLYYLTMPEDDALQLFRDTGGATAVTPVRSVTSIAIGTTGTVVYYDQWEDGYVGNIQTSADLTWGDGNLANGCPPSISNTPNPCLVAADDSLQAGDVVVLDNLVVVEGSPGSYSRDSGKVFFDGRDKFQASQPVAVSRALWPTGPGSLQAGGIEMQEYGLWGDLYEFPLTESTDYTGMYEHVIYFIMAGPQGATVDVDANGDGDVNDAGDSNDLFLAEGAKFSVHNPSAGGTIRVVDGSDIQVTVTYADTSDTYEMRWSTLQPRRDWSNDYVSPVGTTDKGSDEASTRVWVYNPKASAITVNYTLGNPTATGTFSVPAGGVAPSPEVGYNRAMRVYTSSAADVFLPFSVTDTDNASGGNGGQIYDWDSSLFPTSQLSTRFLVGWAPGCTDESHLGVCRDPDLSPNYASSVSRSMIWVTPLANTTIYVDTNGSDISCPGGAGAEQTITANALYSYRINNDGVTGRNNVRDEFAAAGYNDNGPNHTQNWSTNWIETGDDGVDTGGSMRINGGYLVLREGGAEAGDYITRQRDLSGRIFARFSFQIQGTTVEAGDDAIIAEVSPDGGTTWYALEQFDDPIASLQTKVYNITPYISVNTTIRFRFVDDLETGDQWQIDNVNIEYSTSGDFDMTGAIIQTCDGTRFSAAYGQDPARSESGDSEALDLGTIIVPYAATIDVSLDKQINDDTPNIGDTVTFTLVVANAGPSTASSVYVTDAVPSGYTYVASSITGGSSRDDSNPTGTGLEWRIDSIASGGSVNLTYQAVVDASGEYDNYAEITSHIQADVDSTPGNNSTTEDDDDLVTVQVGGGSPASIGDRIWLDEDGDGLQDAGESGIANVTVELRDGVCTPGVNCPTTITDSQGNYIFTGLAAGSYTVAVTGGLPAGLSANPTYDEDGIGTANTIAVNVSSSEEHVTADFGYNWAPTTDVTNPPLNATGAIGDRVWIDADGDGVQDTGEAGLAGATVTLVTPGADGIFGTGDDGTSTTTTDAAGNYIFDGLAPGAYKVQVLPPAGYTQKGDPDQPGALCSTCDNQTTTPITLAPGDVYVNADFGYQLNSGANTIGNQIFMDANGDGNFDAGEPGIPGVTVALLDVSGNVIATTVTDSSGQYSFPGLPNGTYTVWVNDTANVLGDLAQNSTPNNAANNGQPCGTCNDRNTVTVSGSGSSFQDFGYAPAGHGSGDALIGDTIFLDRDGGNDYDAGEGLEGVTVRLHQDTNGDGNYDAGEPVLATAVTDENGNYYFGNLPAGNYVVRVDTTSLPAGVTNTVDPDTSSSPANESGLTMAAGGVNLTQDFGYRDQSSPNSISGTLWTDTDADGLLEGGESGRFAGVTVFLYDSSGNIVGTTTTDASGNYSFPNLPDGSYRVDVTDSGNVLDGYWHSAGPTPGSNNNSQSDPYNVTVSGGQTNSTADFGYYRTPAAVSDYVWLDRDNDGVQDANEPGIGGVTVTLNITYPNGNVTTYSVQTDANGLYNFGNLLLDENHDGAGGGEPTYALTFSTPPGTAASPTGQGTTSTDSNGTSPTVSGLTEGESDTTYDSGFYTTRLDLGDMPDTYSTYFQPGPAHTIFPDGADPGSEPDTTGGVPAVWLGANVDVESDGQPNTDAVGDDNATSDDEDGLSLAGSGWSAGGSSTATITVNSSASAVTVYFGYWIDWDNNGSLDAFYSGSGVTGSPTSVNVTVSIPPTYTDGTRVYMRVRASTQPFTSANYVGTRWNGEVEDYYYTFNGGVPTPVTLSYFLAQRSGETVNFEWSTATESGNLGFNLYAADNGTLVRLNAQLIPSQAVDSLRRLDYSFAARSNADTFYIEDLAIDGSARRHGPFQLAEPIGSRIDAERMDWAAIASEHLRADNARQARLLPDLTAAPASPSTLLIQVDQSGLYRLTYEMLLDAGLDLRGTPLTRLHLLNNGQRIPITVNGRGTFGPGAYLEFYGEALDTLYTRTNVYTLEVSNTPPARIPLRSSISRTAPLTSYTETLNVHNQKAYANYAPGNDPWYDTLMQVDTSPESWAFPFTVSGLANPANPASLQLTLWGVTDWPQASDHHVIVKINGTPVADELFDGLTAHVINVALPGGLLLEGNNSLEILLPGDTGVLGEVINLDRFSVSYQRMLRAENGRLTFSSSGGNFTVSNLPSRNVVVYRLDASGLARLGRVRLTQSGATFNAAFASNGRPATYFVYDASAFLSPNFEVASTHSDLDLPAQYLIISHPNFIADLAPLVQARQAQGFTVNVVDVNDLYARYAHHTLDPQAIRQYLAYAEHNLGTQYVLLVGGDSYDYLDHLGAGSLSFIPSLYVPIGSIARFTPADALYADTDGDNAPNLALGRFPVRTRTELQTLIQKTLAYASKDYGLTATFSADRFDGVVSYRTINDDLVAALPNGWTVENIYLDDLSTAQARTLLLAAMNRGTALVTYTGHSAPSMWNYSSFFNSAHANSLSNAGRPFVAVQYGCWNNYYVDPLNNTLAHSLLVGGDRGAAASIGASTLVDSSSEALFGALLTPRLTTPAMTIGQAFLSAKQNLAYLNPSLLDVLLGYSLLGDPALVVQQ
ncbi:MAG: hypothetical protein HFACDABA_01046 [Anaerolineales bacterium]|nr:hypothetical protein [Anaerolineales bacterium]